MKTKHRLPNALFTLAIAAAAAWSHDAGAQARIPLSDGWKLQSAASIAADGAALSGGAYDFAGWHDVRVPSTVLAALAEADALPDPYYGDNLTRIDGYREGRWMVMPPDSPYRSPWWYCTSFELPNEYAGKQITLHFDGINYEANIWLNGKKIADRTDVIGMFRRFQFAVTANFVGQGANHLAVEIIAPAQGEDKVYRTKQIEATTGWDDHCPQPPDANMGIWEDVYVEATGAVTVRHPYVMPELAVPSLDRADLTVEAQVVNLTGVAVALELAGVIEGIQFAQPVTLEPGESKWVRFRPEEFSQLRLEKPRVWWPNPLGPQELYECTLTASVDGHPSDAKSTRFGVRQLTTYINDEGWRTYVVNGKEILIRGGAWMTADMMMRFDPRQTEALVRYAKEANLNMLRSEGFSIRETDEFYDLCDEYGIMVTQQLFGRSIPDEALAVACVEDTILRIRNHPSLAHFLGHDETFPTPTLDAAYKDLIAKHIPDRTYQPHSGAFDVEERFETGGTRTGTRELWTFAHPTKYYTGKEDGAWGFAQSGGIGGIVVSHESMKRMMPAEALWPPTNPTWSLHTVIQGFDFFETVREQVDARYGAADGIEAFCRKAGALNYECARAMFEAYGREKYSATGITTWKYNVAWPAAMTWAYIDWYSNATAAYYGAKKACEPLHVQYSYDDDSIWVVNSLRQEFRDLVVTARIYDKHMAVRGEQTAKVKVGPDGKTKAFVLEMPSDLSTLYFLKLTLADTSGVTLSDNFYWLSTTPEIPGDMKDSWTDFQLNPKSVPDYTELNTLPPVTLEAASELRLDGDETVATVTIRNPSPHLAFGIQLALHAGSDGLEVGPTYWSDNYFSLLPGEKRRIDGRITTAHLNGARAELRVDGWNVSTPPAANSAEAAPKEEPVSTGREYHVSERGDDAHDGTLERPLRTISAAAQRAQPGDAVTVHEGVYREWVNPPRGGASDTIRITYQAAPGARAEIRGSEPVSGWTKVQDDTWSVAIPNSVFGDYNPYADPIQGDWFNPKDRSHHTGAVYLNGNWLLEAATLEDALKPVEGEARWFGRVDADTTTIWAQFPGLNPNEHEVEINVRPTVLYPEKTGVNYLTVRGFILRNAATQWAPPTAEQVGLVGTNWSKGWIIEDNVISHSRCTGLTLGKYGDAWDNTSEDTAEGYVLTIQRALENGWSMDTIGHHVVRNNTIAHCEQAGIAGSLGAIASTITGNTIHDIHVQRLFTGAEMAGVKIHAAVDSEISRNRIFRTVRGIWLDWMAQGASVRENVLYENASEDLFMEVNHGPFLVANNIFLSKRALLDMSQGGAYAHNLMAGEIVARPELSRETPHLEAHGTEVAGLSRTDGGDNRFLNNLFVGSAGLAVYDNAAHPIQASGNVYLHGATPPASEPDALVLDGFDPGIALSEDGGSLHLTIALEKDWSGLGTRALITTESLGMAKIPQLPYLNPDRSPMRIDRDYAGTPRDAERPFPGPFEIVGNGAKVVTVYPVIARDRR
ncbi:MAG: right-handed parallel beta-helix repeat-containing protein [Candidatus Hydrogenedentes bacterium]|nr:right-handed parallel beta-helix repeat-containing protein [Candidatus Hydrogenedentota bacterium]